MSKETPVRIEPIEVVYPSFKPSEQLVERLSGVIGDQAQSLDLYSYSSIEIPRDVYSERRVIRGLKLAEQALASESGAIWQFSRVNLGDASSRHDLNIRLTIAAQHRYKVYIDNLENDYLKQFGKQESEPFCMYTTIPKNSIDKSPLVVASELAELSSEMSHPSAKERYGASFSRLMGRSTMRKVC